MSRLESRTRLLLHAYPQPYRAERGEEILATLLEVAPDGRNWPTARESWWLTVWGMRVRAARNRQLPLLTNLRLAALVASAIWLIQSVSTYVDLARDEVMTNQLLGAVLFGLCALVACLAIVSAWFWRRGVTVALAVLVLAVLALASQQVGGLFTADQTVPPLALAALAMGKVRPPRCWLWIPAVAIIVQPPGIPFIPYVAIPGPLFNFFPLDPLVFLALLVLTVLWFVADARPLIAFGLYLEVICVLGTADAMQGTGAATASQAVVIALLAAVLAGASLRARRGAATGP
jgi:hypothetical protein